MKKTLCWLAAMLFAMPVLADDLFEHPQTPAQAQAILRAAMPDLGQIQVLRGRFGQRKYLSEIPQPLSSAGEFLLVRDLGVWWHAQAPLDSAVTLTHDGLVQLDSGTAAQGRTSLRQPGSQFVASVFFALFALDIDTLARSFDLFMTESDGHWQLGLRPRDASLAAWFRQATISGSERVEQVRLVEAAGDRTEIDLDAAAQPRSSLTPAERQRFEP
ncbi:MAG: outer membrane lipoprotein carrier protein LolA [Immundisolibacter sp.]|uniref:outer membrane lipoprotein carrier protein LolA n=1 Tax=Immundisolibacter sp. TaxID=1934948 RepID=UPI003EE1FAEA